MTIKKPMKAGAAEPAGETPVIADRFKLNAQESGGSGSSGGAAATVALVAGLVALSVVGVLTFVIYQHWEFLKGA